MRVIHIIAISLSVLMHNAAIAKGAANYNAENLPTYSKIYDERRDPFADANAALALAKASNRQVLIEIGGNWCSWCKKMASFLAQNPEVSQALHQQYVLLKVNVSDSNENSEFMKALPPVLGYPHMYVSTAGGKMILSKDTAELLDNDDYSTVKWLNFLDEWSVNNFALQAQQNSAKSGE